MAKKPRRPRRAPLPSAQEMADRVLAVTYSFASAAHESKEADDVVLNAAYLMVAAMEDKLRRLYKPDSSAASFDAVLKSMQQGARTLLPRFFYYMTEGHQEEYIARLRASETDDPPD